MDVSKDLSAYLSLPTSLDFRRLSRISPLGRFLERVESSSVDPDHGGFSLLLGHSSGVEGRFPAHFAACVIDRENGHRRQIILERQQEFSRKAVAEATSGNINPV